MNLWRMKVEPLGMKVEPLGMRAHFMIGGMQFLTHFNGFLILARNLFAGGFGCKTILLKGLQNNRRLARS